MTESSDLRATLRALAIEQVGELTFGPDDDLAEHLDSMQRLALVVAVEDHFAIAFEPEDEEAAQTLADVERLVAARLAARSSETQRDG